MIDISIVIPVYNAEKYIKRTIESIIKQTVKSIEILIVNDGSKDNSLSIIQQLSRKYKRIKYFTQKNLGVSAARNVGISAAKGDYIMFMDADDILNNNALETLLNNAQKYDADISIGNIKNIVEGEAIADDINNTILRKYTNDEMLKMFFLDNAPFNCFSSCGKIYSKKIYKNLCFINNRQSNEDRFYFFQSICITNNIVYENKCVYFYEKHINSLSNSKVDTRIMDNMFFADKMLEYIKEHKKNLTEYAEYNKIITYMMVYRNFYRDKDSKKLYSNHLDKIKKFIINIDIRKVSFDKKIEIFIIKFLPCMYYIMLKIYDRISNYKRK